MADGAAARWSIPLQGPLAQGQCVWMQWPEDADIDAITALRNRPDVRRQFLDPAPLEAQRNREWLRHGMNRPYEALLAIRLKFDGAFVGAIGWSKGDPVARSFELGRVMVDARSLVPYRHLFPADYPGIAVDAGTALRDFAFALLELELVRMTVIEGNQLSLRAAVTAGGRVVGTRTHRRSDGSALQLLDLEYSRADWLRRAPRPLAAVREPPAAAALTP